MYLINITNTGNTFDVEAAVGGGSFTSMRLVDSSRMWVLSLSTSIIHEVVFTNPGTLGGGAMLSGNSVNIAGAGSFVYGFDVSPDLAFIYGVNLTNDTLFKWQLGTPGDLSSGVTLVSGNNVDLNPPEGSVTALDMVLSDSRIHFAGNNDTIYQWDMGTPGDLTTAADSGFSLDVSGQATNSRCIRFAIAGTKMLYSGSGFDRVFEYDCPAPYSMNPNPVYSGNFWNLQAVVSGPVAFEFLNDNKIFVLADTPGFPSSQNIFEFDFVPDLPTQDYENLTVDSNIVQSLTLNSLIKA